MRGIDVIFYDSEFGFVMLMVWMKNRKEWDFIIDSAGGAQEFHLKGGILLLSTTYFELRVFLVRKP